MQKKYATVALRRAAARQREIIRDLPRKLDTVRRRHRHIVLEIKRANLEHLLEAEEKDW
jgi:hypothetical protein